MKLSHLSLAILVLCCTVVGQTQFQTLPRGYDAAEGNASSNFPQNTADDQIWQWAYAASEFDATGPIKITNIGIRPKAGQLVNTFNFTSWEVTLGESQRDYDQLNSTMGRNFLRSELVRSGGWTGGPFIPLPGGAVGGNIWMNLDRPFIYDPTNGNDLIIQVSKCGTPLAWGTQMDAVSVVGTGIGGDRIGHLTDCTALVADSNGTGSNFVPIVRIAYEPASQTLPAGFDTTEGTGQVGWPVTSTDDQKWQWHYDAGEFEVEGPMAITEIWLRPNDGTSVNAFSFQNFDVTLGTASTGYLPSEHSPEFGANLHHQELVRSGPWSSPFVGATGGTGEWIPLGLQRAFVYDPSQGRDLIVQIETCGVTTPWFTLMDSALGTLGSMGGMRYGNTQSCTSLFSNQAPPANDLVPIVRIDFEPVTGREGAIDRFPWREDFDDVIGTAPNGWHQVAGEAPDSPSDWLVASGQTPSAGTGPNGDHTSGLGNYMFVEDSLSDNDTVRLLSPVLDLRTLSSPRLSFWLHSNSTSGTTASTLAVDVLTMPGGGFAENILVEGDTGQLWVERTIDLSLWSARRVRLRFRVNNDNGGFGHDIAIDDVRVYSASVPFGQAPTNVAGLDVSRALNDNGLPLSLGVAGPYTRPLHFGENAVYTVTGTPGQPLILWTGSLNVANAVFPGIGQLDTGPNDIAVLIDGVGNTGVIPGPAVIGPGGEFTFSGAWTVPPGFSIPLQALVYTGGPTVLALSNAVVLESL